MTMINPFQDIAERLSSIEDLLVGLKSEPTLIPLRAEENKPLTLSEAATYLGVAEQTLYQNIKRIPHRKKFGRLYFFKHELLNYLDGKEGQQNG